MSPPLLCELVLNMVKKDKITHYSIIPTGAKPQVSRNLFLLLPYVKLITTFHAENL